MRALAGPHTQVVDLAGGFVAPGFNDAHLHLLHVERWTSPTPLTSPRSSGASVAYAAANPRAPGSPGAAGSTAPFPAGLPHRRQLDEVVADRPALMTGYDGHTAWANTRALRPPASRARRRTRRGGAIARDASGDATGVLKESAIALVRKHVPPPSDDEKYRALKRRLDEAASYGLTSVQNASALGPARLRARAGRGRPQGAGVFGPRLRQRTPRRRSSARYRALREKHRGPLLKLGAVKGFVDGVVESGTAAMLEPYVVTGGTGIPNWTEEDLNRTAALYDKERLPDLPARDRRPGDPHGPRRLCPRDARERHARSPASRGAHRGPAAGRPAPLQDPRRDRLHPGPVRQPRPEHAGGLREEPRAEAGGARDAVPLAGRGGRGAGLRQRLSRVLDAQRWPGSTPRSPAPRPRERRPGAGSRRSASPRRRRCATSPWTRPTRASTRT